MTGMGRARIKKSPIIFAEAFAYQNAVRLMQVPGTAWFQMRSRGEHCTIVAMMLAKAYSIT